MSHRATNWAVTVKGIPPVQKVVLWHLSDRHNKDTGECFPSQELLAADCEISRSSLNNQLAALEKAGLIERQKRQDDGTKRQKSTSYILRFDRNRPLSVDARVQDLDTEAVSKKDADPCPKIGESRVQDLDTNPVKEPVKNLCVADTHTFFKEFWDAHPRAVKRDESLAAFGEALSVGIDPQWIVHSARLYAKEQQGNGKQYIATSLSWLDNSRWADFDPPASKPKPEDRSAMIERMLKSSVPSVRETARKMQEAMQ